jgi:GH18 family chitinase
MKRILIALLVLAPSAKAQWYTAYYGTWSERPLGTSTYNYEVLGQEPRDVDWTGITHVVHFGNGNTTTTPPYSTLATDDSELRFGPEGNQNVDYQQQLLQVCHARGIKVLLSIQAVDGTSVNYMCRDSIRVEVFADWFVGYCRERGYDGVEFDLESNFPPTDQLAMFIRRIRAALDAKYSPVHALFLLSPGLSDYNRYPATLDQYIDQYNVQLYALMWTPNDNNLTWHECCLYTGNTVGGTQGAIDNLSNGEEGHLQKWINAGHSPAKLGMGLPTFGYLVRGADGLFQPTSGGVLGHNGNMTVTQNSYLTGLLNYGGAWTWDEVRKMAYISGTATASLPGPQGGIAAGQKFFATVPTPQWVRAVVAYGKAKGFGGFMLYSLAEDLDPSKPAGAGRNLIHDAMRDALGGPTAAAPLPSGTFIASPSSLPYGGGLVKLSWISAYATSASLGGGEELPPNGQLTVGVPMTTTWTLTISGSGGTKALTASVVVAPPPLTGPCDTLAYFQAGRQSGFLAGIASTHIPDSAEGYALGFAAGQRAAAVHDTLWLPMDDSSQMDRANKKPGKKASKSKSAKRERTTP